MKLILVGGFRLRVITQLTINQSINKIKYTRSGFRTYSTCPLLSFTDLCYNYLVIIYIVSVKQLYSAKSYSIL